MKVQYSKILPVICFIVFISCIAKVFMTDMSSVMDVSVYATLITVTGGMTATCINCYLKKAGSENAFKLRMGLYEESVKQRLFFNEEMLKMKIKYNATDEDIAELDENGEIDEFMSEALSSTTEVVDTAQNGSDELTDIN